MTEEITREIVFEKLFNSFNYGNLGMFIGAGVSKAIIDNGYYRALGWFELIQVASNSLGVEFPSDDKLIGVSLPELATKMCESLSAKNDISYKDAKFLFKQEICKLSTWLPQEGNLDTYREIFEIINPAWIITTNYDLVIETILTGRCKSLNPKNYLSAPKGITPVYHLHGTRLDPSSIIITQEDYIPLFRPNEYRQSKLAMTIRESTTLVLGYSLGDMNVLSALDWSKNIYTIEDEFPYDIVQVLWTNSPKPQPYYDVNGNIVIETNDLEKFLNELVSQIVEKQHALDLDMKELNRYIELLESNSEHNRRIRQRFIDNDDNYRIKLLDLLSVFEYHMISPYIQFLTECIGEIWSKSSEDGAFEMYDKYLKIIMDIIIHYEFKKMPPRLFQILSDALDKVMRYVGETTNTRIKGEAWEATVTWHENKSRIPLEMLNELYLYASQNGLGSLRRKLNPLITVSQ